MSYDLKTLKDKFFSDPDWSMMEELIEEYLAPFRDVANINEGWTNDQVASEVRGRKLMIQSLDKFLADSGITSRKNPHSNRPNYK